MDAAGRKQVNLSFIRPEDVSLYERLEKMAYERRYPMATFLMLSLHEAFREEGDPTDAE